MTDADYRVLAVYGNNKSSPVQPEGIEVRDPDKPSNDSLVRGRSRSEAETDISGRLARRLHSLDVTILQFLFVGSAGAKETFEAGRGDSWRGARFHC